MDRVVAVLGGRVCVEYVGRAKHPALTAALAHSESKRTVPLDVFAACYYESHDAMIAAYIASERHSRGGLCRASLSGER